MNTLDQKNLKELEKEIIIKIREYIYSGEVNTKSSRRAELKDIITKFAEKENENKNN
jgi:hypothetical protein